MARNLDILVGLVVQGWERGALNAEEVVRTLQRVELEPRVSVQKDALGYHGEFGKSDIGLAGPSTEDVMNQWRRGGSGPGVAGEPGPIGRTDPDVPPAATAGEPGEMTFLGGAVFPKPAKPE